MSTHIEEIIKTAEGTIDEALLTQTGEGGILSTGYLHSQPLSEYLEDGETLAYLFDNQKKGIEVHRDGDEQTITPGSNYRTIAAVTSRRILFVIGQASGDEVVEIPLSSVKTATTHSGFHSSKSRGFQTDRLEIETIDGTVQFYLRSDSETVEAAKYINQQRPTSSDTRETPQSKGGRASESSNSIGSETGKDRTSSAATRGAEATTDGAQVSDDEPIEVEYVLHDVISEETLTLVWETETTVREVGTEIENIETARERLTRAHNELCQVLATDVRGIATDRLGRRISEIEQRLDALQTAVSHITDATDSNDTETTRDTKIQSYKNALNAVEGTDLRLPGIEAAVMELRQQTSPSGGNEMSHVESTEGETNGTTVTKESPDKGDSGASTSRREEMCDELIAAASELGRMPKYEDLDDYGRFTPQEYTDEFNSWKQVLEAANIDIEQRLLDALRSVADQLDTVPTQSDVDEYGTYDSEWYSTHFEDFDAALAAAGIDKPDEETLLNELHRLQNELGFPPSGQHVEKYGKHPAAAYRKVFGSVRKAVGEAELDNKAAVIDAIRAIAVSLERRPMTKDFGEYAEYSSSYVYNYFDGWRDACAAADVDSDEAVEEFVASHSASDILAVFERAPVTDALPKPDVTSEDRAGTPEQRKSVDRDESSRDELLDELEAVTADLKRIPSYSDMYDYDGVDPVKYTEEFGSWKQALDESALDIQSRLLTALEELVKELNRVPTWDEIDKQGQYGARWYEDYFDSLDDALSQANLEVPFETDQTRESEPETVQPTTPDSIADVSPSPLAEYYEVFGNLKEVQTALLGEDIIDRIDETSPTARWHILVRDRWAGDSSSRSMSESYRSQQHERTEFPMSDYRESHGNGNRLTDFRAIETAPLPDAVTELLSTLAEMEASNPADVRIPVAPDSRVPLPVFVESEAEYERAKALLGEFPERPSISIESSEDEKETETGTPTAASGEDGTEPGDELTDVGGITASIAAALRNAGYESKDDLRAANTEDLMEVDGIESQTANRIKLLVGG